MASNQQQWGGANKQYYAPPPGPPQPMPNNGAYYPQPPQQQQQQYQEPQQPYYAPEKQDGSGRFQAKKRINDPIFAVLFLASLLGWVALSVVTIMQFSKYNGLGGGVGSVKQGKTGTAVTLDYHTVYLLLLVAAAGLLFASLYLMLVRAMTKIIMEVTLALNVLLNIGTAIYYFYIKYWSGAIIFTVIAIFSVLSYWFMRKRIPLARLLLQTVMDISKHHPSVYAVVLIGLVVQTALSCWYAFTNVAIYVTYTPGSAACATNSCSSGKVTGLIVLVTFMFLWTSQVCANLTLCTLAGGVYGGWYFNGPRYPGGGVPKGASAKAFGRAATTSLGSVAFGSLIVTLLELLQQLFNVISQQEAGSGDAVGAILACVASCCVGCIRGMVEYFNKYAYIEISLYGKGYIPSAKAAWHLLKDRGVDALVNDSLVGITLTWGAYVVGFLCGLFAYLYLRFTNPSYNSGGQYSAVIILFGFLIGLNCGLTLSSALEGGVSTIFVGLGEDPEVLRDRSPGLFNLIAEQYPRVVQSVNGV